MRPSTLPCETARRLKLAVTQLREAPYPQTTQGDELCAEQSPALPAARRPGTDADSTSTPSSARFLHSSGATVMTRKLSRRATSSRGCSDSETDPRVSGPQLACTDLHGPARTCSRPPRGFGTTGLAVCLPLCGPQDFAGQFVEDPRAFAQTHILGPHDRQIDAREIVEKRYVDRLRPDVRP